MQLTVIHENKQLQSVYLIQKMYWEKTKNKQNIPLLLLLFSLALWQYFLFMEDALLTREWFSV